jgi:hypothetical protein
MTVPNIPYEHYQVETPDHHVGTIDVYDGVIVEVSASLVEYLGEPWADVCDQLTEVLISRS